jgi:hypothetical protein
VLGRAGEIATAARRRNAAVALRLLLEVDVDKELARIVANAALRSSRELADLVPLLTAHADAEDASVRKGIARAIAEIGTEVLAPVYARFPELEREFSENVERYGRTS